MTLNGYIDCCSPNLISGWAWDSSRPALRLDLEILAGRSTLGRVTADRYRADLRQAGIGDGAHAFAYVPPQPIDLFVQPISVVVANTDFRLSEPAAVERYEDPGSEELFVPVAPWAMPQRRECHFYHSHNLPGGETIEDATWDLRGRFKSYIGGYPLVGKTVLDVGTASGFLAFSAEEAGAAKVTAFDGLHYRDFERIPFEGSMFTDDRLRYIAEHEGHFRAMKNGFWYAWHKKGSAVEVVYAPATQLWRWRRKFDVVIAGAIIEHLSDPIPFIGALAGLAKNAVILAGTQVIDSDRQFMETINAWDVPDYNYSWWLLSRGLYERVFKNLGFDLEFTTAISRCNIPGVPQEQEKPTIIASRRHVS